MAKEEGGVSEAPQLRVVAPERKGISQKRRFDLFKRDGFTCQYCGRTPPAVVLEVDHIVAVSRGGGNTSDNLVTACYDCNRGKAAGDLASVPQSLKERAELADERRKQVAAYERMLRKARKAIDDGVDFVVATYERVQPGYTVTPTGRRNIRQFLDRLPPSEVADALELSFAKTYLDDPWRYFYAVCWRKIRESQGG